MSELLRQHFEKLIPLTDEKFDYIRSHFSIRSLKKHQYLIQEGDKVDNDYWVAKGLLKSFYTDETGREHILQFAMEDWWISDYLAYANNSPASLNVDCVEDCEVFGLSLNNREKLCNELHDMANFFRKKSSGGFIGVQQRILLLLLKNPRERYDRLLQLNPKLMQRVPKILLASYLGVSRESLSRFSM
jgi:CRP-like cAMP-binding protein